MADPLSVGLAIANVGTSLFQGFGAKSDAKKAADLQAKLTYDQRMEEIRRQEAQMDWREGATVAGIGASNILLSGSSKRFLDALRMENARQVAWAKAAAEREKRAIKKGAQGVGSAFFAQAAGDALGAAASLYANRSQPTVTNYSSLTQVPLNAPDSLAPSAGT